MSPGIVVALSVLAVLLAGAFLWYRRSIAALRPDTTKPVSCVRLTAEALHRAPSPPWRVVHEVGGALGDIDHVLVGPTGVTAISTLVADRPRPQRLLDDRGEALLVSDAAITRGPLDELLRPINASCDRSAQVYWGAPDHRRLPAEQLVHASLLVEGQRIDEWLAHDVEQTPEPLDQHRIDTVWRTIVIGIGRPDPLP